MNKVIMQKYRREAFIIFVAVLMAYGYFSWGVDWNTSSRISLVKAVVEEGVFEIDSYQTTELSTNDKAYINGHFYSDKAIGSSVIGVIIYYPIYWAFSISNTELSTQSFTELLTFLAVSLPAALIAPFSYVLVKQITNNPGKALAVSLGISLGTPLFKYSTAYYGHSLAAASYFLAFLIWFNARRKKIISPQLAFLSTLLLGYMLITEYPTALLLLLIVPYILYCLYESGQFFSWKIYAAMAIGFLTPISILLYYNNTVFGTLITTGYAHEASEAYNTAHQESIMGIGAPSIFVFWYQTFQPAFGIFWQSPILFLAFPGWFHMLRTREYRLEAIFSLAAIFSYILLLSGYYMWWGGLAFAPRHLIPILPLFVIPLAFIPNIFGGPLIISALASVFQNLLLTASDFEGLGTYLNDHLRPIWKIHGILQPRGMLVYDICLPNVIKGNLMNNRGLDLFKLSGASSLAPLIFFESALVSLLLKSGLRKEAPDTKS